MLPQSRTEVRSWLGEVSTVLLGEKGRGTEKRTKRDIGRTGKNGPEGQGLFLFFCFLVCGGRFFCPDNITQHIMDACQH